MTGILKVTAFKSKSRLKCLIKLKTTERSNCSSDERPWCSEYAYYYYFYSVGCFKSKCYYARALQNLKSTVNLYFLIID